MVVRATADGRALLVLADTWFPGWNAKVDGREAPIVRTDQLLRGVVIGARDPHRRVRLPAAELADRLDRVPADGGGAARRSGGGDDQPARRAAVRRARARLRLARAAAGQGALELGHALVPGAVGGLEAGGPQARANPELGDAPQQMQPFLREVKQSLPDIPLWNPWITAGRPLHADAQSAIFSPFNVPAYVMDEWRALALIAALKLWVAAFGGFLLARALCDALAGRG